VHLPWCLKKCPYCDFNSHENAGGRPACPSAYLDALRPTWKPALPLVWGRRVQRVHRRRHAQPVLARGIDRLLADIRARLPLEPAARSRWRPTPAPSSASASAPFAPPA
jgi:coproporphyrinogen III oxidase-like Fe-S oxidoreductase